MVRGVTPIQPEEIITYPVRKPKVLPTDIRCGLCPAKFSTCQACSEHMKTHYRDRLGNPPTAASTTATTMGLNSPRTFVPASPRSPRPPPPPPPRSRTAPGPQSSVKAGNAGDVTPRSHSEPFGAMMQKGELTQGNLPMSPRQRVAHKMGLSVSVQQEQQQQQQQDKKQHEKPPKVHVCYFCQGEFSDALSLTRHSRTHGGSKPYSCSQCGRHFALYSSLMNHEQSHTPGGRHTFRCKECPAAFLHEASLKAHQRRHNSERTAGPGISKPYQCDACHEWLSNEGALRIHMQRHEGFETPNVCSRCGTSFSCQAFLQAHHKLHEAEPTTRCVICIRHFRRSRVLLRHSDVHAAERQNVCDSCERRFPKVGDGSWRRMHLLLGEERSYTCLYCGAAFHRLNQLAAHEAGHTDPPTHTLSAAASPRMRYDGSPRPMVPMVVVN